MSPGNRIALYCLLLATVFLALPRALQAQELSPRAFWPAPQGTRIVTMGYSYTSGDTLTDPSLPITGIDSDIHNAFATLFQTFNLAGRTANVIVEVPYLWGNSAGDVGDSIEIDRDFDGLGDIAVTLSVNLLGAPSMDRQEFTQLRADPHPLMGASLRIVTPSGEYDKDTVINSGANRWAGKAEVGFIYPLHPKWLLEFETGAWYFGDNEDFVAGNREQDPIYSAETHLIRRFSPGFWSSLDLNYFRGGRSTINGDKKDDLQRTSKYGVTFVYPFSQGKALKLVYSGGSLSGKNNDFDTVILSFNAKLP